MTKPNITAVKKKPSYMATLRAIPLNETQSFEMIGGVKIAMLVAKSRLAPEGYEFKFVTDDETNLLHITRISKKRRTKYGTPIQ